MLRQGQYSIFISCFGFVNVQDEVAFLNTCSTCVNVKALGMF